MAAESYADPPAQPAPLSECSFYHSIDLPGLGTQAGPWDLRPGIDRYLGSFDFAGKRTLEIGTANGFVCFELERRGAEVVAFDLAADLTYDAPPLPKDQLHSETYRQGLQRIRNAYWLTHRLLGSRARVAYGHANALPAFLGHFDVAVLANVLQHLKDPVGAVMQAASISDAVVVTESDWLAGTHDDLQGLIFFDDENPYTWYQVKPKLITTVLARMGFGDFTIERHTQRLIQDVPHSTEAGPAGRPQNIDVPHFTITGRRQ
jgi:SAM-dependent methyltransferase